jgi:aryl sulfotransferase
MGVRAASRVYRHAVWDSSHWLNFIPRSDDIVIATSMKAGTTWTQGIVASLLWPDGDAPGFFGELSPWLDARWPGIDEVLATLEAQQHRRFIKTHTPADGIPIFDDMRYIVVGRDGRDVFMSIINHWEKMRHGFTRMLNELAGPDVPDLPLWDGDVHGFFDSFISKGSFPWEGDGAPWWSHFNHCLTWWELREQPNVLMVHYNDLLADLEGEMRRIAAFLAIDVPERAWPSAVERCRIDEMRDGAKKAGFMDLGFIGGADSFFYRGSNGRWRGVLTGEELERYDKRVAEVLSPDAAQWLEHGRRAAIDA